MIRSPLHGPLSSCTLRHVGIKRYNNTILTQQYYTDTTVLYWRNSTILTQQHYWHNNTILTQHYTDTTILYWHNTILTQQHYTDTILYWHLLLPSPFTLNTLKQLSPHLCPSIPRYLTIRITTNNCLHNCLHYHWHWQVPDSLSLSLSISSSIPTWVSHKLHTDSSPRDHHYWTPSISVFILSSTFSNNFYNIPEFSRLQSLVSPRSAARLPSVRPSIPAAHFTLCSGLSHSVVATVPSVPAVALSWSHPPPAFCTIDLHVRKSSPAPVASSSGVVPPLPFTPS